MTKYANAPGDSKLPVEKRKVATKIGAPSGPMVGVKLKKRTTKRVAGKR